MNQQRTASAMTDAQKTAYIQQVIRQAGDQARQRWPVLQRQNLIGGSVMAFSVTGMLLAAVAYQHQYLAWWLCIPLVAILQSLVHELEHDLIHLMYFKDKPWAYNLMLLLCWLTRPSTVSPWLRKELHFHHHKHSGSRNDLEERGITNGTPWGLRRLLMTGDNLAAVWMRPLQTFAMIRDYANSLNPANRSERNHHMLRAFNGYFPIGLAHYALWYSFLAIHGAMLLGPVFGHPLQLSAAQQHNLALLDFLAVVWLIPSHLRTFCLHFVSSNLHYYGDIQERNVMQQCQVITAWWMAPLQLFCFNFGSTHAIHHFVVRDPFYIRQLTARPAHQAMRAMGVRFNDFGTFRRANRYHLQATPKAVSSELATAK